MIRRMLLRWYGVGLPLSPRGKPPCPLRSTSFHSARYQATV